MKQLFDKKELVLLIFGFALISVILAVSTYAKLEELNKIQDKALSDITITTPQSTIIPTFTVITASSLKNKLDNKEDFILVDARLSQDFNESHIKGAVNIPLVDIVEKSKDLSKDKALVVMCYNTSCQSADKAAKEFSKLGFTNITVFKEGMDGWTKVGYPTVTES